MNSPRRVIAALLCLVALASPRAARAGEFGPTSRGALSISVTIPPRVTIATAVRARNGGEGAAAGWCIRTRGLRNYHVDVLGSLPADAFGSLACEDRGSRPLLQPVDAAIVEDPRSVRDDSVSIIIVPD